MSFTLLNYAIMRQFLQIVVMLFLGHEAFSQMKVMLGDFKNLKGIATYNVTFDYTDLQVHGFDSEDAYLQDKMAKRETKEGEAENFKENWYSDRTNKYEPKFIEYINNRFEKGEIQVGRNNDAPYTMYIKTTWIYPGYNVVAGKEPAKISATITISESANPGNILLVVDFKRSIGLEPGTFEFDQGYRIAGAYEKLAKNMVIQLKRFL